MGSEACLTGLAETVAVVQKQDVRDAERAAAPQAAPSDASRVVGSQILA